MSFLKLLFGKSTPSNVTQNPDLVWLTKEAKFAAIRQYLERDSTNNCVAILVISHFQETHQEMTKLVEQYVGTTPAIAILASELTPDIPANLAVSQDDEIVLIVAQLHPLAKQDVKVVEDFAAAFHCRCRVNRHVSLEDGVMKFFAGESMGEMMRKMGMDEHEPIESRFVSRRIRAAQKKIEAQAIGNRPATSEEEWFEQNLPNPLS